MGVPDEFWIGFVIMVGFFLKLIYDIKLGWNAGTMNAGVWQDLESGVYTPGGHLSVLQYYFTHHMLPDVDPRTAACFSNPPLYYITSSIILEILHRMMGWSISISLHLVQCMNVIYVMVGECCGIGILQKFGLRGRKQVVSILFLIFFPVFYNLSGAMDGSAMCFMYSMLALNSALSWYDSRREKTLRSCAIEIGLGLMVSPAAALVLPPVIYLIRKSAVDGRRNETPVPEQIRMFTVIVAVLGLWWQVYLMIRFRLPLFYVNTDGLSRTAGSAGSRFALPSLAMFRHIHMDGTAVLESNFWAQTLKTAAADFLAIDISRGAIRACVLVLFALAGAVLLIQHAMLFYTLLSMRMEHVHAVFIIIGELTFITGYIAACLIYPYTEMMDFKRIAPALVFPLIGMGLCGGEISDSPFEKVTSAVSGFLVLLLSVLTAFLYGFYVV